MSRPRMIVLAAGQGTRLRPLTLDVPKCMVPLHGRPLIEWQLRTAATSGMTEVILVGGFKVDQLRKLDARLVENPDYATTNMVASLFCAEEFFDDGFVVAYGDIIYNPLVLERLLASPHDIAVVVDRQWRAYWSQRSANILDDAESLRLDDSGRIVSIGQKVVDAAEIQGQYIGLVSIRCAGLAAMRELVADERAANLRGASLVAPGKSFRTLYMTDLLQGLIDACTDVWPVWVDGGWLEIDTLRDLALAEQLTVVEEQALRVVRSGECS